MNNQQERLKKVLASAKDANKKGDFNKYHEVLLAMYPELRYSITRQEYYEYKNGLYAWRHNKNVETEILGELYKNFPDRALKETHAKDKLALMRTHEGFVVEENIAADLLNVENGLLSLSDFRLLPHTPEVVSFSQLPIEYNPLAICPLWEKTVDEWMLGNKEQIRLLQQISGYLLTPYTFTNKVFWFLGGGGNGKNKYVELMTKIVGREFTSNLTLTALSTDWGPAELMDKKVNFIDEVAGKYIETDVIKRLSSGGSIVANVKYKAPVHFDLITKFVFTVNEIPKRNDFTASIDRRFVIVKWDADFTKNPNLYLTEQLSLELPGILNWCLEGLRDLKENGYKFTVTNINEETAREVKEESSPVMQFLADHEDELELTGKDDDYIPVADLFKKFGLYAEEIMSGGRMTRESFSIQLRDIAWTQYGVKLERRIKKIDGKTKRMIIGIKKKPTGEWINDPDVQVADKGGKLPF